MTVEECQGSAPLRPGWDRTKWVSWAHLLAHPHTEASYSRLNEMRQASCESHSGAYADPGSYPHGTRHTTTGSASILERGALQEYGVTSWEFYHGGTWWSALEGLDRIEGCKDRYTTEVWGILQPLDCTSSNPYLNIYVPFPFTQLLINSECSREGGLFFLLISLTNLSLSSQNWRWNPRNAILIHFTSNYPSTYFCWFVGNFTGI